MQPVLQVQIAALGQYTYCPRRCALMYLENLMEVNEHTVAGTVLHQTVDEPAAESRGSIVSPARKGGSGLKLQFLPII